VGSTSGEKRNPKVSLAVGLGSRHGGGDLRTMIRPLLLALFGASVLLASGCNLLSRKTDKPKESKAIAAEVAEGFEQRWVEQRSAQLVAQGVAAPAARAQATTEFAERYAYTKPAPKK
jgi:hypothetical protein